eukprot:1139134-Pelagomonas_calceolata.AAC.1
MEPKWRFAAAALLACTGLMMVVLCAPTFLVPRCVPIHPALNGIAASSKTLHACLESRFWYNCGLKALCVSCTRCQCGLK